MTERLDFAHNRLATLSRTLSAVSPLATLDRGYALALKEDNTTPLTDVAQIQVAQRIKVRLARGQLVCQVDEIERPDKTDG